MSKRTHLRAVKNNPETEQAPKQEAGISYQTIIIVTLVTTVAGQLVIDAYRAIKESWKQKREAEMGQPPGAAPQARALPQPNFHTQQLPPALPTAPALQNPWTGQEPQQAEPVQQEQHPLSAEELGEWQRQLERKEGTLERWEGNLQSEQRHLRLVTGSSE